MQTVFSEETTNELLLSKLVNILRIYPSVVLIVVSTESCWEAVCPEGWRFSEDGTHCIEIEQAPSAEMLDRSRELDHPVETTNTGAKVDWAAPLIGVRLSWTHS